MRGHAAIGGDTEDAELRAKVIVARKAAGALAAPPQWLDHHAISGGPSLDTVADGIDHATDLVPRTRRGARHLAEKPMQVAPADTAPTHAYPSFV